MLCSYPASGPTLPLSSPGGEISQEFTAIEICDAAVPRPRLARGTGSLARSPISSGCQPPGRSSLLALLARRTPAAIWTGRAIIDLDASIGGHGSQGPIRPDDMALRDLATGRCFACPPRPDTPDRQPPPSCRDDSRSGGLPNSGRLDQGVSGRNRDSADEALNPAAGPALDRQGSALGSAGQCQVRPPGAWRTA